MFKSKPVIERLTLVSQKGYQFLIFSKAISRRVVQIPAYNGGVINRHRPRAAGYLNSGFTCQQIRYLKSLIANMAGFLLWLSETNIMIEVFKVASAQWI